MIGDKKDPFNISLLQIQENQLRTMGQVTSLDTFESSGSSNFHDRGLFSTSLFGRVGSDERDRRFAYIDLKTNILHPVTYDRLKKVSSFYSDILHGKAYATWDDKTKTFIRVDDATGETGYSFFMSHWHELKLEPGDSEIRKVRVELLDKYREASRNRYLAVMPAGLRDAERDELGRIKEGEVNEFYRKLLSISNTIGDVKDTESSVFDKARLTQQFAFNLLYENIENLLTGKQGFLQKKWARRNVINSTRNVISAMDISVADLDDNSSPGPDDTVIGLWQASRATLPIVINRLRENILSNVFGDVEGGAKLIDVSTLKSEIVSIAPQTYDRWNTAEGLEKVIASMATVDLRDKPVMVEGRYLALIYRPKNVKVFKIFYDIDDLPAELDRSNVHPMTLCEMIYLCNYRGWNTMKVLPTRYPITGEGSIYPSNLYLKTTVNSEIRVELDYNWKHPDDAENFTAGVYPIFNPSVYVDTTLVHPSRLSGLGGD
jgi:hypothetical protein